MNIELEDHPLPPDTWGEAPQTALSLEADSSPTTYPVSTVTPPPTGN
jgi:hypothetical protein